jgi:hypothetical protein
LERESEHARKTVAGKMKGEGIQTRVVRARHRRGKKMKRGQEEGNEGEQRSRGRVGSAGDEEL